MANKIIPKYDIIIIGAGIAGSIAAKLLARQGYSILLLEKDPYSGKTNACGGLFDRPYFDRYVNKPSVLEQRIKKNIFHLPWGNVVYNCDQVTVKRRVFDRYLSEQAAAAGAKVMYLQKVEDYVLEKVGQVVVTVRDIQKKQLWQAQAKAIIFSDGPNSLAFKNPRFQKQVKKQFWAYAYAYEVEGVACPGDEAHIYFSPQIYPWGYGWIFPNKKESNIGVGSILSEIKKAALKPKLFYFLNKFPATAPLLKNRKIVDKKGGYIPMWLMSHCTDDSQVLVGDAGGMVSPLFGAGIDYAIEAAEAASLVLSRAIQKNEFSAAFLKQYDQEIYQRFGKQLRKQMMIARVIILSQRFGRYWPVKLLSVSAFGAKYSRWNKIKILTYPLLGKPKVNENRQPVIDHK